MIENITPKFVAQKTSKAGKEYWAVTLVDSKETYFTRDRTIATALRDNVKKTVSVEINGSEITSLNAGKEVRSGEEREFHLSPEEVRARALESALVVHKMPLADVKEVEIFWTTVHDFEKYIKGGITPLFHIQNDRN